MKSGGRRSFIVSFVVEGDRPSTSEDVVTRLVFGSDKDWMPDLQREFMKEGAIVPPSILIKDLIPVGEDDIRFHRNH